MYLPLTDEQTFLQEAAADALARHATVAAARDALDGTPYPDLWPLAVDAGWSGLLVGEDADGVGLGAYEAMLILEVSGRKLADTRLLGHLPATALLEAAGAEPALRSALARGEKRAALLDAEAGGRRGQLTGVVEGDAVTLDGVVKGVLDAPEADVLVVVADADNTPVLAVVDPSASGATVTRKSAYDGTRLIADVALSGVSGRRVVLDPAKAGAGRALQRALLAAESVGSADACLAMATAYAKDRVAFGRPIGSYQAIKHKLVEMLRRVEGGRSLMFAAGGAWDEEDPSAFVLAANAARTVAADALDYAGSENIFIHGGVGATWEHDAQLFYRRGEVSRRLAGGAGAAADTVAEVLLAAA